MVKTGVLVVLLSFLFLQVANAKLLNIPENIENLLNDSELLAWEPPEYLRKNFTYYQSGVDEEGRPIWVFEYGHWNIVSIAETGGKDLKEFEKFLDQAFTHVIKSVEANALDENFPLQTVILICDLEDVPLEMVLSVPVGQLVVRLFAKYVRYHMVQDLLHKAYVINTNFVAETLIRLVRPILGETFARAEVYGTNREKWIPVLAQNLPRDQLPPWYGGKRKDFKPLKVFG